VLAFSTTRTQWLLSLVLAFAVNALLAIQPCSSQETGGTLPDLMGDLFDGGLRTITFTTPFEVSFLATGVVLPGVMPTTVALERDGIGFPDDVFAEQAFDGIGDPITNTFTLTGEPLPPSEVPTSPGPSFVFAGGDAVFTGDTSQTTPTTDRLAPPGTPGTYFVDYSFVQTTTALIPAGGGGVAVRRIKLSENNNPLPRNRVFFNYHFFNDVRGNLGDVSRYTLGVERTFADGQASFEFRVPFAATLDNIQTVNPPFDRNFEFGNAALIWKILMWQQQAWSFTTGTGVTIPIAASTELFLGPTNVLEVENDSVHFLPYMAAAWNPNSRFFSQTFVQFDIDPYGNTVFADVPDLANLPTGPRTLPAIGKFNDATMLFVDVGFGGWLYRNNCGRLVKGIAEVVEFHYSTTVSDTDQVEGNGLLLGDLSRRLDVLNVTLATHFSLRGGLEVSSGFGIPVRSGFDKPFDFEYLLQVDKTY